MKKWYEVYHEIAEKIYKLIESPVRSVQILQSDIKVKNSNKELFELFYADEGFRDLNKWIEKFVPDNRSLDPLHVFASLNSANLNQEKRLKRVQVICKILKLDIPVEIDFTSCPTPVATMVLITRDYSGIIEITNCFYHAFNNELDRLSTSFDSALKINGIDVVNLSVFLFWINPEKFIPLDKNTLRWISENIPHVRGIKVESFKDYSKYLDGEISNRITYLKLANFAYYGNDSNSINFQNSTLDSINNNKRSIEKQLENLVELEYHYCKLFAIKVLDNCNKIYSKSVTKNKIYLFDNQFRVEQDIILLNEEISIYNHRENKTNSSRIKEYNIYAIVGKNGSGKSTLVELILASIQKSRKLIMNDSSDDILKGLCIELYFYINNEVYCLVVEEEKIYLYKYEKSIVGKEFHFTRSNKQIDDKQTIKEIMNISYHLSINYSHFAFNSRVSVS